MSILSGIHVLIGLVAVIVGCVIFARRKGDARHRVLGWWLTACLLTSLAAILLHGLHKPSPFLAYAGVIFAGVVAAVLVSRFRDRVPGWRAWHGALMSFSMLGATVAIGGVVGGVLRGVGNGPDYFRMFNVVIAVVTTAGIWLIFTRPVIWGGATASRERRIRIWATTGMILVSAGLILGQYLLLIRV
jgi:uncharacterized membrane protein